MQEIENEQEEERIMQQVLAESAEEAIMRLSLEESKNDLDQFENMTYEQILEFEERNGKVSKGLNARQIHNIPSKVCQVPDEDGCVICCCGFEKRQRLKFFKKCGHEFHAACIDKWLQENKKCPICNLEVK